MNFFLTNIISTIIMFAAFLNKIGSDKKTLQRNNIVVIAFHKIGDAVHTLPAIKKLYKIYSDNLVILCYPENKIIYEIASIKCKTVSISKELFWKSRISRSAARKELKSMAPKQIYDLTGNILSASLIIGQKAEKVFGITEEPFTGLFTKYKLKRKTPHLIDLYTDGVEAGLPGIKDFEKEHVTISTENAAILIHPFAGWEAKEWNLKKYIELALKLSEEYNCSVICTRNSIPIDIKREISDTKLPLIETIDLENLIKEIKKCSLFVGNDSGPLYIANLLGKPTFTIYGPTNPSYSLPFGKHHSFIRKELKCSPYGDNQYCFTDAGRNGCPTFECMNTLSITEVLNQLKKLLTILEIRKKRNESVTAC